MIICALVDFDLLGPNFCNGSKWTQPKHNTYCLLISAPISKVLLFYGEIGAGDIVLSPLYSGGSLQYLRRNRVCKLVIEHDEDAILDAIVDMLNASNLFL
uniref:RNA binding protein n=1 Tax=Solanum tuberosum TaxID=4113 RepID=M1BN00_SOLTU